MCGLTNLIWLEKSLKLFLAINGDGLSSILVSKAVLCLLEITNDSLCLIPQLFVLLVDKCSDHLHLLHIQPFVAENYGGKLGWWIFNGFIRVTYLISKNQYSNFLFFECFSRWLKFGQDTWRSAALDFCCLWFLLSCGFVFLGLLARVNWCFTNKEVFPFVAHRSVFRRLWVSCCHFIERSTVRRLQDKWSGRDSLIPCLLSSNFGK